MTPLLGVSKASIQLLVTQLYTNTIHFYAIFLVLLGNHLYRDRRYNHNVQTRNYLFFAAFNPAFLTFSYFESPSHVIRLHKKIF